MIIILDSRLQAVKKDTDALLFASKDNGLDMNVDKTKYMVMPQVQNSGRNHNL